MRRVRSSFLLPVLALAAATCLVYVSAGFAQNGIQPAQRTFDRATKEPKFRSDRVLVRFRAATPRARMQAAHDQMGASVVGEPAIVDHLQVVQPKQGMTVQDAIHRYRANPDVLYAEPDYIVQAFDVVPNDPMFSLQWNLHNTGQNGGTAGADIHAEQAWALSTGSSNVVVAVLDTGIDYTHPDLAAQVWSAPAAFAASGDNGVEVNCPAGSRGFNAVANDCDPQDDNGHGTHVSGILGAVGNNGVGVAGVNWNVTILPCKFLNDIGVGDLSSVLGCLSLIKSLKDSGVNIVATNNSWGGFDYSQALQEAINAQLQDGILFVAAAGNNFSDNDLYPVYPASISLPNVIAVAATDQSDRGC